VSAMDLSVPVVLAPPGEVTLPDVPILENSAFARQRGPYQPSDGISEFAPGMALAPLDRQVELRLVFIVTLQRRERDPQEADWLGKRHLVLEQGHRYAFELAAARDRSGS
jgi:hypothetical protein